MDGRAVRTNMCTQDQPNWDHMIRRLQDIELTKKIEPLVSFRGRVFFRKLLWSRVNYTRDDLGFVYAVM